MPQRNWPILPVTLTEAHAGTPTRPKPARRCQPSVAAVMGAQRLGPRRHPGVGLLSAGVGLPNPTCSPRKARSRSSPPSSGRAAAPPAPATASAWRAAGSLNRRSHSCFRRPSVRLPARRQAPEPWTPAWPQPALISAWSASTHTPHLCPRLAHMLDPHALLRAPSAELQHTSPCD